MMNTRPLSPEDIKRLAKLARLALTEQEVLAVNADLNHIFTLIETMRDVDTRGVEPMAHPQDLSLRLRTDAVAVTDLRDVFLSLAPESEAGLFLVPKVIE